MTGTPLSLKPTSGVVHNNSKILSKSHEEPLFESILFQKTVLGGDFMSFAWEDNQDDLSFDLLKRIYQIIIILQYFQTGKS